MKALKEAIMKRRAAKLHDLHGDGDDPHGMTSEQMRSTSGLAPEVKDSPESEEQGENPLAELELEVNPDEKGMPMKPEMEVHGSPGLLEQMMKDVKGEEGKPTIAGKAAAKMKAAYEAMRAKKHG